MNEKTLYYVLFADNSSFDISIVDGPDTYEEAYEYMQRKAKAHILYGIFDEIPLGYMDLNDEQMRTLAETHHMSYSCKDFSAEAWDYVDLYYWNIVPVP